MDKLTSVTPEQETTSVLLPVHGIVPPLNPLVLLCVAVLSHAPEQDPHAFHGDHVPSPTISIG